MFVFMNIVDEVVWSVRDFKAEASSVNTSSEQITICSASSCYDHGIVSLTNKKEKIVVTNLVYHLVRRYLR